MGSKKVRQVTFEDLVKKYPERSPAYYKDWPKPKIDVIHELIKKYNCSFSKSFIEFQTKYCHEVSMGDFASDGFGWANKDLMSYLRLDEIVSDYRDLEFPDYLTPFRYENGDYWCFDHRVELDEYPIVIFDHNAFDIEQNKNYQWSSFIEWLDHTMEK